jgi:hypothetical protein
MNERIMAAPEGDAQNIATLATHVSRDLYWAAMSHEHTAVKASASSSRRVANGWA